MTGQLLATALVMGLVGSPHCAAMCAAGCGAAARACASRPGGKAATTSSMLLLILTGRALSYAAAGALAAASAGGVRTLADSVNWLRPFWGMAQVAALLLGLSLLWQGRQPQWLDILAVKVSAWSRGRFGTGLAQVPPALRALAAGALWVALPCGLLYSALVVAALASSPQEGAAVMLAFSVGGAVMLFGGPALWWRVVGRRAGGGGASVARGDVWAVRLAGAMLAGASAWALGHGLWMPLLAWCGLA